MHPMDRINPNDYDRVAYPTMAHPQTFVEGLAAKALLRGMNPAPPAQARVLELGCGDGFNLAAMAVLNPTASYTGIDYSASTIERGRAMLKELNVAQVRLEAADIRGLDPSFGEFDYIIAHGVYSWVPEEVRDAVLAVMGRHLAPNGVAFVSYVALPGGYLREMVRTMVRFHTRAETGIHERTAQARVLMQLLASATEEPNVYTQWIKTEAKLLEYHTDEAFFHDELSDESKPLLFVEFLEHASRHSLRFLCEAEYITPVAQRLTEKTREQLKPLEANRVLLEQYLDFIEGRRFRQTLLCRPGLGEHLAADKLDQLFISAQAKPVGGPAEITSSDPLELQGKKNVFLRATTPIEKAALGELIAERGGALPFPEFLLRVRSQLSKAGVELNADDEAKLRLYIIRGAVPGMIELSWAPSRHAVDVPQHPRAHPFSGWSLERGASAIFSYLGQFVEVEGALGRELLRLLNGTRDRATLLREIRNFLDQQSAQPTAAGAAQLPSADAEDLAAQLDRSLEGLTQLGLIERETRPELHSSV